MLAKEERSFKDNTAKPSLGKIGGQCRTGRTTADDTDLKIRLIGRHKECTPVYFVMLYRGCFETRRFSAKLQRENAWFQTEQSIIVLAGLIKRLSENRLWSPG